MLDRILGVFLTISMISTLGCATSYAPREPGRVSIVGPDLVKDGKHFSIGLLSSEPVDAVSGNPAAEEEARRHVRRKRAAGVLYLLGGGSLAGSIALRTGSGEDPARNAAALGLLFVAVPAFLVSSLIVFNSARGYLDNAVNIYNDGVWEGAKKGALPIGR